MRRLDVLKTLREKRVAVDETRWIESCIDNFRGPKISLTSSGTDALEVVEKAGFTIPPNSCSITILSTSQYLTGITLYISIDLRTCVNCVRLRQSVR